MEKFKYQKGWLFHEGMGIGYPTIGLVSFVGYSFIGMEFKPWVPFVIIGLIIWVIYAIIKFTKANSFSVELNERSIRVSDVELKWETITKIEILGGLGANAALKLTSVDGTSIEIPGATDSIQYIKGFIEGHVKNILIT